MAPKGGSPPWPLATDQDDQFNCRLQLPLDKKWGNVTASRCSCRHAPATASHALRPSPLARDRRRARFQLTKGLFRYAPVPGRASEEAASRAWPLTAGSRRPNGNWGRDLRQLGKGQNRAYCGAFPARCGVLGLRPDASARDACTSAGTKEPSPGTSMGPGACRPPEPMS